MHTVRSALSLTLVALSSSAFPAYAQRVVVVTFGDAPTYQQALAGIRRSAGSEVQATPGEREETLAATLARGTRDAAVVALGTRATEAVARASPSSPAIGCMTTGDAQAGTNMATVPLAVPLDLQLPWLRRLLPQAKSVAVLYDPALNARLAAELEQGLARAGYQPMVEPVPSPAALPRALERIANADALLAIPDTTVYSPETAKGLLLFTFRTRTPLIAFSDAWVRAGALYALEWDYQELGAHCATLALRLAGNARTPPPPLPRPHVTVNLRSAAQFKLKWDASALAETDKRHE